MKARSLLTIVLAAAICVALASASLGAPPPISTTEMLAVLERALFGAIGDGAIAPRVLKLEQAAFGSQGEGALSDRIEKLWAEFGGGREGVTDLDYQIKFSQWLAEGKISPGNLIDRIDSLEKALIGYSSKDSLSSRIKRMILITAGSAGIEASYVKLPAGTRVRVVLRSLLSTSFTRPGEKVDLEVGEDVFIADKLAIPKGTLWQAEATDPTTSDKYDMKNLIELAISPVVALDGTPVKLIVDDGAMEDTRLEFGYLISQGDRPEKLGFFGIGNAMDRLLPGSKNLSIPKGTTIILSVREDVSVMAVKAK